MARSSRNAFFEGIKPFVLLLFFILAASALKAQVRAMTNFDSDWHFIKEDISGAEKPVYNDSKWRILNVPHDWSIEGPYNQTNLTARGGGYLPSGIGWYRKSFSLNESDAGRLHSIEFDGVMANSDVWINGFHLGKRPYGYSSFSYDLTKHLNYGKGKINTIAVKADNTIQPASRYYTGAGIYRHVRLVSVNAVHFSQWGTYITTPLATAQKATVNLKAEVVNSGTQSKEYIVSTTLLDAAGKTVKTQESKQNIAAGATVQFVQEITLNNPQLWDIEVPYLYQAVTKVLSVGTVLDDQTLSFGIRDAKFDSAEGFLLNGKHYKIKGVCLHHDGGAVGAAVPIRVWEQRFKLLKQVGVNGIRTSHNPVAPEFLDLCDRMGFVVMNETFDTWTEAKHNGEMGYNQYWAKWWEQDTRDMVMRDRNHPSVIIYSIGNEIHDNLNDPKGFKMYKDQQDLVHKLDPSRPVTMALFRPAVSKVYTNGFAETMDVVGQNYRENELLAAHEAHPDWKVIGTENTHVLSMWLALRDHPYMSGQFLWTGFDYLGEADWPEITNNQGLFDRAGNWKPAGLQRQSWWSDKPVVHLVRKSDNAGAGTWVANWTPTDFDTYDNAKVQVYSNCEEVELFLNGKTLGVLPKPANDSPREYDVTFEEGTIKVVGKNKGKEVAFEEFKSAGAAAKIILTTDHTTLSSGKGDVTFVYATLVDAKGIPCPNAINLIKFDISGPAIIKAVDNGDILSHELYQASQRFAYNGKVIAIIEAKKGSGKVTVKAESASLQAGMLSLEVEL
ncbi:glycoside hydrolase family 2 TIM barrel-domain containing protein [Arcticibacter eurypsychrophilus]|uniref:glycoside hydrolase family 2 TIM barrel-domain containing protein n=1 Tax=Arcticibacter eurypsychrophilus TaxID=1434752 RepID=UPI0009F65138|nr:glycoside hydrolase family 2 TIM barrel-domain containing protein [Arcticibacter eurypsychrophilus]